MTFSTKVTWFAFASMDWASLYTRSASYDPDELVGARSAIRMRGLAIILQDFDAAGSALELSRAPVDPNRIPWRYRSPYGSATLH